MRKLLVATLAFIVSYIGGTALLLLITVGVYHMGTAAYHRTHPGIGAIAGGMSAMTVFAVPVLCGIIGFLTTPHRMDRISFRP